MVCVAAVRILAPFRRDVAREHVPSNAVSRGRLTPAGWAVVALLCGWGVVIAIAVSLV